MFDSFVIAAVLTVLLADLIGETREYLQGGPNEEGRPEELLQNLRTPYTRAEVFRKPFVQPIPSEEYHEREEQKLEKEKNQQTSELSGTKGEV